MVTPLPPFLHRSFIPIAAMGIPLSLTEKRNQAGSLPCYAIYAHISFFGPLWPPSRAGSCRAHDRALDRLATDRLFFRSAYAKIVRDSQTNNRKRPLHSLLSLPSSRVSPMIVVAISCQIPFSSSLPLFPLLHFPGIPLATTLLFSSLFFPETCLPPSLL